MQKDSGKKESTTISHHDNFPRNIFSTTVSHATASHSTISYDFPLDNFPFDSFPKTDSHQDSFPLDIFPEDNFPLDIFPSRQFPTTTVSHNDIFPLYDILLLKIILLNLLYQSKVFGLFVNHIIYSGSITGNEF